MPQTQHYLPRTYLKQWCTSGTLIEYRRVGPQAKLIGRKKSPKSIACEPDLYTLPPGGIANGLTGNELESKLARDVDARIPEIVASVSAFSHRVSDARVSDDVRWLMRTFVARSATGVRRGEDGYPAILERHREMIERLQARAATDDIRAELRSFLDPRMPSVMTRAMVGAIIDRVEPRGDRSWLDGDVHVVQSRDVGRWLSAAGASAFVTFHEPVVEWDNHVVATFALSPSTLAIILAAGTQLDDGGYGAIVLRHTLLPLAYRRGLLCRDPASGELLARAARLIPWDHAAEKSR